MPAPSAAGYARSVRLDEFASYDAVGLAELLRSGDVTQADLRQCVADGIDLVNPTLNAVLPADASVFTADQSEGTAPLAGVPTLLKDLFHGLAGWPCGNGSRLAPDWVVPTTSEFTQRILSAGLTPLGRTTTSEFGILGTTETLAAGRTCSPWSAQHMAGGSSGGAAAAVGAGIVPVATASDGGGSIRIPASACGVVGLKPSRGRIPWGPNIAEALSGWAVHFMVSRSVRDAAVLLDALSGPEIGDPFEIAPPARTYTSELELPPKRLRIGVATRPWSGHEPDPEITAATLATAQILVELGHEVDATEDLLEWEPFLAAMTDVWAADASQTIDDLATLIGRPVDLTTVEPVTLAAVEHGRQVTAVQLLDALDHANVVARSMGAYFASHDVMLTPTLGRLPAPLGRYQPDAAMTLSGIFADWGAWECFLPAFNATGQPAISLPLHQSNDGLPIGMQLVGSSGSEATLLRLAAELEVALPWAGRIPPLHVSR